MAAIAAVVGVVIVYVTCHTFGAVILVEAEILLMFEGGRYPCILIMTLSTIALDLAVQVVDWIAVARVALLLQSWFK